MTVPETRNLLKECPRCHSKLSFDPKFGIADLNVGPLPIGPSPVCKNPDCQLQMIYTRKLQRGDQYAIMVFEDDFDVDNWKTAFLTKRLELIRELGDPKYINITIDAPKT